MTSSTNAFQKQTLARDLANLGLVLFEWGLVFLPAWLAEKSGFIWMQVLAIVFIGTRIHALGILMHEAAHYNLLSNRKANDIVGKLFLSWSALFDIESYRASHLAHHRDPLTGNDPTYVRKLTNPAFQFPKSKWQNLKLSLFILCGGGLISTLMDLKRLSKAKSTVKFSVWRGLYYVILLSAFFYFHWWGYYFKYWVIPCVTVYSLINYWRSVAEHLAIPVGEGHTRSVVLSPILQFFFLPYHIGFHGEHHEYPQRRWYELGEASTTELSPEHRWSTDLFGFFTDCSHSTTSTSSSLVSDRP